MTRLPSFGWALLFGLALFATAATVRADSPSPEDDRIDALVRALGSDNFDTREDATRALGELGRKALKALEAGAKSDDMEIARRCAELLERANRSDLEVALDSFLETKDEKLLLQVPAWGRFQKFAGNDPAARNLFVLMCTADGVLLDALERNIDKASQMFNERCQQLQQRVFRGLGVEQQQVTNGELAALLYAGMEPRLRIDQNVRYAVNNIVQQPGPQQWVRSDAVVRKLLAGYIQARTDTNLVSSHLYLVQNLGLVECREWVAKQVENKGQQPYVRAQALGALGRFGPDSLPLLERFLSDTTVLNNLQIGGTPNQMIRTEMRDVALGMAVVASGQDIATYEFPWLKQIASNPGFNQPLQQIATQSPFQLGFADNAQREAALKRFNGWKEAQKK